MKDNKHQTNNVTLHLNELDIEAQDRHYAIRRKEIKTTVERNRENRKNEQNQH